MMALYWRGGYCNGVAGFIVLKPKPQIIEQSLWYLMRFGGLALACREFGVWPIRAIGKGAHPKGWSPGVVGIM